MAGTDETTPQGGSPTTGVDGPTEVLPTAGGGIPEPTLPLPASPWSRPDPTWSAPDPTWAPPQQDWAATQQDWAATPQQDWTATRQDWAATPQQAWADTPQQAWGAPQQQGWTAQQQQGWASAAAGQTGHTGYGSGAQPGSAASGPPQYSAAYQPGGYPPATPARPTRRGRGVTFVLAMLLAFVLAGAGTGWATRSMFGSERPSSTPTEPQVVPSKPQVAPSTGNGGQTTSNEVSDTESVGVVLIEARSSAGLGAGTGMVLTPEGRVLTNYHVVAGSEKLSVTIADSGDTYAATVIGFDQARDVALIQLKDASGLSTVRTDTQVPDVGAKVAAVGNAEGGGELVKASGAVTATDQDLTVSSESPWGNTEDLTGLIQTNAKAVPGDSGGPMFDSDDEVIGMTTAGSTSERTSYAVPIATALQVVQQIDTGQDAGTTRVGPAGYLGIKVDDGQSGSGKTVTDVVAGSPAAKAGMTAGSRLDQVGGTAIRASTNLATVIRALEPGAQVRVVWTTAGGAQRTATVTLGSSPVA